MLLVYSAYPPYRLNKLRDDVFVDNVEQFPAHELECEEIIPSSVNKTLCNLIVLPYRTYARIPELSVSQSPESRTVFEAERTLVVALRPIPQAQ